MEVTYKIGIGWIKGSKIINKRNKHIFFFRKRIFLFIHILRLFRRVIIAQSPASYSHHVQRDASFHLYTRRKTT